MKPIQLKDWVPSNPNRETRRKLEKEIEKLKPLLKIDYAFAEAIMEGRVEYDLMLGFFGQQYKEAVDLLLSRNRFQCFDIVDDFIRLKYGYDKEKVTKYDNSVQILEPIRKFINK